MIQTKLCEIKKHVDPLRLKNTIGNITNYHRIQASPGYEQAAEYCRGILQKAGMKAEILYYPANQDVRFQTFSGIQAWSCKAAWCVLEDTGMRIADFEGDPMSIFQRSAPWKDSKKRLEIVELNRGPKEEAYEDIDLAGKLVFVHDQYTPYKEWAVDKKGAVGIISDCVIEEEGVSERYDQLDCRRYTSFWWTPAEKKAFGFVLSPREGDKLRKLCRKKREEGKYPAAFCMMDSKLEDGQMCNVTAVIEGQTKEEILLTAHLCHPQSSANDNASGVTAVVEAVALLNRMIGQGLIPIPKRSIRVLLTPEYAGSYAYLSSLSEAERSMIKGAMNLDMVGGRQDGQRGPLILHETPHSTPSIVNAMAQLIFDELRGDVSALNAVDHLPMINTYISEFIDGSDHAVYNDPACSIPTPLLCQWPDRYYHTSGDSIEQIDLRVLKLSCTTAAVFSYCMASLECEDIPALLLRNHTRMAECLEKLMRSYFTGRLSMEQTGVIAEHYLRYFSESAQDILRYFQGEERKQAEKLCEEAMINLKLSFKTMINIKVPEMKKEIELVSEDWIPQRHFFGPASFGGIRTNERGESAYQKYCEKVSGYTGEDYTALTVYYIDGIRTAAEIGQLVSMDLRLADTEPIQAYLQFLKESGVITEKMGGGK